VRLSPLSVLVSLLAGVQLFGLLGALLAIPVAGIFQVVAKDIYQDRQRRRAEAAVQAMGNAGQAMGNTTVAPPVPLPDEPLVSATPPPSTGDVTASSAVDAVSAPNGTPVGGNGAEAGGGLGAECHPPVDEPPPGARQRFEPADAPD